MEKRELPTLADLHSNPDEAFKNDALKTILNAQPHATWIKKNKYAKDAQYLPIDKVEFLLDKIFQEWNIEVKKTAQLFNAVEVTVRVHYLHPISGLWRFHDGVGAKELQTKSESGALNPDLSNINKAAVEMALPIAKSTAIKDACDHLGKLFGRDLNRKDTIADFAGSYSQTKERAAAAEKQDPAHSLPQPDIAPPSKPVAAQQAPPPPMEVAPPPTFPDFVL